MEFPMGGSVPVASGAIARGATRAWPALLLVAAALAGCLGGSSAPLQVDEAGATPTLFSADRGAIVGTVISQESLPVPLAKVELVDKRITTLTNRLGEYNFSLLQPGPYTVRVTAGENEPEAQSTRVQAATFVVVDFQLDLQQPVRFVPRLLTVVESGHISCSARGTDCPAYPGDATRRTFEHHFEGKPIGFLYEVVWHPFPFPDGPPDLPPPWNPEGQPGWIQRLQVIATLEPEGGNQNSNQPYMWAHFNFTSREEVPEGPASVVINTFPAGGFESPGVAYEVSFDVYMTAFYEEDQFRWICQAPPDACPALPR